MKISVHIKICKVRAGDSLRWLPVTRTKLVQRNRLRRIFLDSFQSKALKKMRVLKWDQSALGANQWISQWMVTDTSFPLCSNDSDNKLSQRSFTRISYPQNKSCCAQTIEINTSPQTNKLIVTGCFNNHFILTVPTLAAIKVTRYPTHVKQYRCPQNSEIAMGTTHHYKPYIADTIHEFKDESS